MAAISFLVMSVTNVFGENAAMQNIPGKPNIILFLVDDMGLMDTSVPMLTDESGHAKKYPLNEYYRTPSMERLAGEGIRFSTFYAQSVCSPSRISILTGQNATRHSVTNWINPRNKNTRDRWSPNWNWEGLRKGDATIPGVLKTAGYWTIHVGKAHFGPLNHEGCDPLNLGFDVNIGGWAWGQPGSYYGKNNYKRNGKEAFSAVPHMEKYHGREMYLSEALTIEASAEMTKAAKAGRPFFLQMAHYAVHTPFEGDPRFAPNYKDSGKDKKAQIFATMIEGIDKSLGDLMDTLEELGVAENTLIFFLGDNGSDAPMGPIHGITSSAPLRGKKATHYEGGMRIPFIASWANANPDHPNQKKLPILSGAIQTQTGTIMDLYPTILNLAKAKNPESHIIDGHDLKPLLTGKPDPSREDNFLMHYPHEHRSKYFTVYRLGDWKLVYHYFAGEEEMYKEHYELFNLKEDLSESNNLAETNPEKLSEMMKGMIRQLEAEGGQYPVRDRKVVKPVMPTWIN